MASTNETGHTKNIANQKSLNEILGGFGTDYAPSNALIKLTALQTKHTTCESLQSDVNAKNGIYQPIENARMIEFKDVKPIARAVRSASKSSGAGKNFVTDVNVSVNKLLGARVSKATPTEKDPAGTSASQQSYDSTVNNFDAMVQMLKGEPKYNPSKVNIKVAALTTKQTALNGANNAVKVAVVPYNKALAKRNKEMYLAETGLVDVAAAAKNEVRSIYGFSSPEFKRVSKLQFRKLVNIV